MSFPLVTQLPIEIKDDTTYTSLIISDKKYSDLAQDITNHILDYEIKYDKNFAELGPDLNQDQPIIKGSLLQVARSLGLCAFLQRENVILVLNTSEDDGLQNTSDEQTFPRDLLRGGLIPILSKILDYHVKFYPVISESDKLLRNLYEQYDIPYFFANKTYEFGDKDMTFQNSVQEVSFDALFLININNPTPDSKYNIEDIKADFRGWFTFTDDMKVINGIKRPLENIRNGETFTSDLIGERYDTSNLIRNIINIIVEEGQGLPRSYVDKNLPHYEKIIKASLEIY